jgi:hypothetical protein
MWTDPVVDEIHQIRQQMLADAGGDFHAFMDKVRREQACSKRVVIESPIDISPDGVEPDSPSTR